MSNSINFKEFIFLQLPPEQRDKYAKRATKHYFKRGDFVFREGETAKSVFFLTKGAVKFIAPARENRKETFLNLSRNSGIFGLWAALHNEKRISDAVVLEDTEVISYTKDDFLDLVSSAPKVSQLMIDYLAKSIREMEEWNLNLRSLDAKARLAQHLLNRSKNEQDKTFKILRLKELASYLNMEPETISRIFATFVKSGHIEKNHRMITIVDEDGLRDEID